MDHGGEAARPTTAGSTSTTELSMAGAVQGSEANIGSGAFDEVPVAVLFHLHHGPGHAVAYANIGELWRQRGSIHVALQVPGLHLPDGVVPVLHDYGYSTLQPSPPGAGHDQVLVDLLPNGYGAGHGEAFVGQLPGGGGGGEVLIAPLPDGVGVVLDGSGNFGHGQQTLPVPGTGRAGGIAGMLRLRDPNLGAGYDGYVALADDLGAVLYDNRGMVAQHLRRRLLPLLGIGASSVAVNGLAAGPGSPAVAFHLFVLLLGGLFLVILHVLRLG